MPSRTPRDTDGPAAEPGPGARNHLGGSGGGGVPGPEAAMLFVGAVVVLFFLGGAFLRQTGEQGLLVAQWAFLFAPAVAFVVLGGYDPRATLQLRRASGRAVAGALLLVSGAAPVAWGLGWLQTFFLPIPWEVLGGLEELVTADSPIRLVWLVVLLAVTPAFCEEFVFRGVLLGGTRTLTPWRFILLNGAVFGAFHLSFETAIRFLPTAWLGIVITWTVWRTRSVWVGVLMHGVNNAAIVFLASVPALRDIFGDAATAPPLWLLPVAAAALWAGVHAIASMPHPNSPSVPPEREEE